LPHPIWHNLRQIMIDYAHTGEDGNWQPLADHLRNVAELATKFAELALSGTYMIQPDWSRNR